VRAAAGARSTGRACQREGAARDDGRAKQRERVAAGAPAASHSTRMTAARRQVGAAAEDDGDGTLDSVTGMSNGVDAAAVRCAP
jgi:hypothetical protein